MTTTLVIIAILTAVSSVTAASSGLVTSAFAKKSGKSGTGSSSSGSSTNNKGTSSTGSTSTGSKSKFIKCVTAISGSPSRVDVDNCWDQVFGSGSSSILGGSFGSSGSSSTSGSSTSGKNSGGSSSSGLGSGT